MGGAGIAEQRHLDYADQGLVVWTAWYENVAGDPPSAGDLESLIASEGLTHTVLTDPGKELEHYFDPEGSTRPTWALIAPGGEILHAGLGLPESDVVEALP